MAQKSGQRGYEAYIVGGCVRDSILGTEPHDYDICTPSYEIAQSWQRLSEGKRIQKHDLTLLKHEIMEHDLMQQGYSQAEAHIITSKEYNYSAESEEYYGKISKYKKDK